jgi:hypothetical protein
MSMELARGNIDEEWCHGFPNISVIVNKYCSYKHQLLLSQHAIPVLPSPMWNACNTPTCGLLTLFWMWTMDFDPSPLRAALLAFGTALVSSQSLSQSVLRLTTGWAVWGSNPGGVVIFRSRSGPPWGPLSLLYKGYWGSFLGVKRPGRGFHHPPHLAPTLRKE